MYRMTHAAKCATNSPRQVQQHDTPRKCDCDGYHTFEELYNHRHALFISLMNILDDKTVYSSPVKSLEHSDGSMFDNYFIAGVKLKDGWISYHLPISYWDMLRVPSTPRFPPWDGHTSDTVIERLLNHFASNHDSRREDTTGGEGLPWCYVSGRRLLGK